MKITKNQLRRIIKEEFVKLHENPEVRRSFRDMEPSPEELKYRQSYHGDLNPQKVESEFEKAVYDMIASLEKQGYDYQEEIAPMILDSVKDILGV
jgi:hypothetical protein